MNHVAERRCVEQVRCRPDDLYLGDRTADGTRPPGAASTRHCHVGDPVFLGRGIIRRNLRRRWHLAVPVGIKPRHVRMGTHNESPEQRRIENRQLW